METVSDDLIPVTIGFKKSGIPVYTLAISCREREWLYFTGQISFYTNTGYFKNHLPN